MADQTVPNSGGDAIKNVVSTQWTTIPCDKKPDKEVFNYVVDDYVDDDYIESGS